MTIVEFFDKDAIENIISSLVCKPENVVMVGHSSDAMEKAIKKYTAIVEKRGIHVNFEIISVTRNELQDIVNVLEKLTEKYGEITIDLTGGEDLYLVAAGIVFSRNPDTVDLHRFNISNGKFYDCDADGNMLSTANHRLTLEENISIYGGRIIFDHEIPQKTHKWDFNEDFKSDIDIMWKICLDDSKEWNRVINNCKAEDADDNSNLHMFTQSLYFTAIPQVALELKNHGLISDVKIINNALSFNCKNHQIKRSLTKAGQILELKVTAFLLSLNDSSDGKLFSDILTGVTIYWDKTAENQPNVNNEIDVLVMKDLVPVFISCKNGGVDVEELYKLSAVAEKFGGKYSKKVLIATEELGGITKRAEEMNIKIIDDFADLSPKNKILKNILN